MVLYQLVNPMIFNYGGTVMRAIVADDELHVRRRLAEKIDWNAMGFEEVVCCSDGDEILEEMRRKKADLILTDIRMARVDGIEAARQARSISPETAIILMSAYDDKDYLKSALDLQVAGYLEKPFGKDQAEEMIRKAADLVRNRRKASQAVGYAARQNRRQGLSRAGERLLHQPLTPEEEREIHFLNPEFSDSECYAVVLARASTSEELETKGLQAESVWDFLEQMEMNAVCAGIRQDAAVLIFAGSESRIIKETGELAGILRHRRPAYLKPGKGKSAGWRIAVGSVGRGHESIADSYVNAAVTMERLFFHAEPILYFSAGTEQSMELTEESLESFRYSVRSGNFPACVSFLENLKQQLQANDGTLVRNVKNHYFRLALDVFENRQENEDHGGSEFYLWELFYQISDLNGLHEFLMELLAASFPKQNGREQGGQIDQILNYIDNHIADADLSLTEISRKYFMSVTYLCMYFKEKTGTTVKSYIIDQRMKKAADLLLYTDLKVTEVAYAVGFSDQSYFTKSFTKYYGVSPSHYKTEGTL